MLAEDIQEQRKVVFFFILKKLVQVNRHSLRFEGGPGLGLIYQAVYDIHYFIRQYLVFIIQNPVQEKKQKNICIRLVILEFRIRTRV